MGHDSRAPASYTGTHPHSEFWTLLLIISQHRIFAITSKFVGPSAVRVSVCKEQTFWVQVERLSQLLALALSDMNACRRAERATRTALNTADFAVGGASGVTFLAANLRDTSWLWGGLRGLPAAATPETCRVSAAYVPYGATTARRCRRSSRGALPRLHAALLQERQQQQQQRQHSAVPQLSEDDPDTHSGTQNDNSQIQHTHRNHMPSERPLPHAPQEAVSQAGRQAAARRALPTAEEVRRVLKGELSLGDGGGSAAGGNPSAAPQPTAPQPALDWRAILAAVRAGEGQPHDSRAALTDSFA